MKEKCVLIDGHSILFRAFHGMPVMTNAEGLPTNALFGFLRILFKILDTEQPDYLAVAFDQAAPTFRHKMYDAYKGTRKPAPPEFKAQEPVMRQILEAMGIPILTKEGWEADDILGTMANRAVLEGLRAVIVSGDHDLLQVASDEICISIPSTRGGQTETEVYFASDVKAKYQVTPKEFIDVKALMGDSSDNIPGLPGVGKVTATKLIVAYGSIEEAHEHLDEIKPNKAQEAMRDHYDLAVLSKDLATIRTDAPVDIAVSDLRMGQIYTPEAYELFKSLGFKSFYDRFESAKETAPAFEWEVITDRAGAERAFEEAARYGTAGVSLLAEGPEVFGLGLSAGDHTYALLAGRSTTEEDSGQVAFNFDGAADDGLDGAFLIEALRGLKAKAALLISGRTKELQKLIGPERAEGWFDTVVAAYLLDPLKSDYDYDDIASEYLKLTCPSPQELAGRKGLAAADPDKLAELAAWDAAVSLRAAAPLREKLKEEGMEALFDEVEMPLTAVLASMENAGIICDPDELKAYGDRLTGRIGELTASIYEKAGEEFNINSPKQLGEILFVKMGLKGGKKTKTGYSTAADVLEKLAADNPVVLDILEYRTLTKLKSTYADGLAAFIGEDGRIHTTFNQTITATGRLSSTDPNLQNIPMREELGRLIRKCFVPSEGCVFVDADYSQIELRILAHMSGDEELIAAYRDAKDIHRITASQVFHVPFDEVTDQQRRDAKAVNFGIIYGISSFGLSRDLSISTREADAYIKDYFAAYPTIHAFLTGQVETAKETGSVRSLFGRKRPIPELKSSNFMQRSFGERVAMNSPIQGTAADIMKIAMIRVYDRLRRDGLKSKLILQIHDELLIEAPLDEAETAAAILKEEMGAAADLKVELKTDGHIGTDWYEAK